MGHMKFRPQDLLICQCLTFFVVTAQQKRRLGAFASMFT